VHLESQNWLGLFSIGGWLIFLSLRSSDLRNTNSSVSSCFALRVATAINADERLDMRVKTKGLTGRQKSRYSGKGAHDGQTLRRMAIGAQVRGQPIAISASIQTAPLRRRVVRIFDNRLNVPVVMKTSSFGLSLLTT